MALAGNSEKTAKPRGKPFQKGQTGNPNGRPKVAEEFREKCRRAVDEHVFKAWKEEVDQRGDHWPKAAEMLAAYGYGKPSQPISGDGEQPLVVQVVTYTGDGQ